LALPLVIREKLKRLPPRRELFVYPAKQLTHKKQSTANRKEVMKIGVFIPLG
jgi:hypothetical protein